MKPTLKQYDPPPIGCDPKKSIYPKLQMPINDWFRFIYDRKSDNRDLGKSFDKLKRTLVIIILIGAVYSCTTPRSGCDATKSMSGYK